MTGSQEVVVPSTISGGMKLAVVDIERLRKSVQWGDDLCRHRCTSRCVSIECSQEESSQAGEETQPESLSGGLRSRV